MDLKEVARFSNQGRHPWELARFEIIDAGIKKIISESGRDKLRVLDIGSGDMYVASEMARRNPKLEVLAVDNHFTPEIMNQFRGQIQSLPVRMFQNLEEVKNDFPGAFDLITLFDVVEHIDKDEAFLKSLRDFGFITKGTQMFITVPSYQALFCSHDVFLDHFRRHTCQTIKTLVEKVGFEKQRMGYFFTSLIPPRILTVLKEKIMGRPKDKGTGLSEWKGGKFKTNLIKGVLICDYRVSAFFLNLGIRIPGLSTFILCKASA